MTDQKKSIAQIAKDAAASAGVILGAPSLPEKPSLPSAGRLGVSDQWASFSWSLEVAAQEGRHGLHGLAILLARLVQAYSIEGLVLDARIRSGKTSVEDLLWPEDTVLDRFGNTMRTLLKRVEPVALSIPDAAIVPNAWEPARLVRAVANLGGEREWGPWRQQNHHSFEAWQPWPLLWVTAAGHHSTLAAIVRGEQGDVSPSATFDARSLLRAVETDGRVWRRSDTGDEVGNVACLPMAALFVVGQRMLDSAPTPPKGQASPD